MCVTLNWESFPKFLLIKFLWNVLCRAASYLFAQSTHFTVVDRSVDTMESRYKKHGASFM